MPTIQRWQPTMATVVVGVARPAWRPGHVDVPGTTTEVPRQSVAAGRVARRRAGAGRADAGRCVAAAGRRATARGTRPKSVIMIWMRGGPSHIDSFDMKPDAPAEIRGEFQPIATNVPGIQICEYMPLHGADHGQAGDRPRHQVERSGRPHAALHPHRLARSRQTAGLRRDRQPLAAARRRPAAVRQPDVQAAGPVRQRRPGLPRPGASAVRAQGARGWRT